MSTLSIFLENVLERYDTAETEEEKTSLKNTMDEVYAFERANALRKCKTANKSIGFNYLMENHKNYERCLEFFSSRMINEILTERSNVRELIHQKYSSYKGFLDDDPNKFLCEKIADYDKDLADFTISNISHMDVFAVYVDPIKDELKWQEEFGKLMTQLDDYYDSMGQKDFTRQEIYVYLFKNNNLLDDFKKYYHIDSEEVERIAKEDGVFGNLKNISNIKTIAQMNSAIKKAAVIRHSRNSEVLKLEKED